MPQPWTRELVCVSIENAFRGRGGAFVATPGEVERLLNYRVRVPSVDEPGWRYLMARSECRAAGISIEDRRRQRGWGRGAFQNGWRRAADTIARGLNLESKNLAEARAQEDAQRRAISSGRIPLTM